MIIQRIVNAYDVLGNVGQRNIYDRTLAAGVTKSNVTHNNKDKNNTNKSKTRKYTKARYEGSVSSTSSSSHEENKTTRDDDSEDSCKTLTGVWTRRDYIDNDHMKSSGSIPNKPSIPTPASPTSSLSVDSNQDTNRETRFVQVLTGEEAIISQLDILRGICIKN